MYLSKIFKTAYSIVSYKDEIIILGEGIYICKNELEKISDDKVWYGIVFNGIILYQVNNGEVIKYYDIKSPKKKGVIDGNFYLFKNIAYDEGLIVNTENGKVLICKDLNIKSLNLKGRLPKLILNENFYKFSDNISCCKMDGGELLWKRHFSELLNSKNLELRGEIVLFEGKLFFYLLDTEENKSGSFVLDAYSGDILYKKESGWGITKVFDNKLFTLNQKEITIINTETYEEEIIDMSSELLVLDKKLKEYTTETNEYLGSSSVYFEFSPTKYVVKDDHLYFTNQSWSFSQIGIIDLIQKKLIWYHEIKVDSDINSTVKDIKVNNDKLCVLDTSNTLHIFEKESV